MNRTILQIYQEHGVLTNIDDLFSRNIVRPEKKNLLRDFLNFNFRDAYESYITSQQYLRDYEHIREKESDNFAVLFNYISRIFVQYYTFSKGNKPKTGLKCRLRKIKNISDDKIFKVRKQDNVLINSI
jgi:hypothetical protein